ncbi:hypothetical protein FIV42_15990 [Persicimonas caeni]|uniref:Uncharacterized protein n=1 Tax=Persicimonas caeni TaxID=2292766 RepID=A0A4Y6PV29_PERCE|nr:hypothetical protein FIV42_15990 [Persicimonas caeni]QED33408.1 hypothetical protein FRD00_15985 [Persicimonas caeni]
MVTTRRAYGCAHRRFLKLSTGSGHFCAATTSGRVECWGDNYHGEADSPSPLTLESRASSYSLTRSTHTANWPRASAAAIAQIAASMPSASVVSTRAPVGRWTKCHSPSSVVTQSAVRAR